MFGCMHGSLSICAREAHLSERICRQFAAQSIPKPNVATELLRF
jgi:hypothetical protein